MSVWRQTGQKPKELDELIELPKSLAPIWRMFNILNDQRTTDFGKPNPIPVSEILACASAYGIELETWEFELILAFDKLKLSQVYSEMEAEQAKGKKNK